MHDIRRLQKYFRSGIPIAEEIVKLPAHRAGWTPWIDDQPGILA